MNQSFRRYLQNKRTISSVCQSAQLEPYLRYYNSYGLQLVVSACHYCMCKEMLIKDAYYTACNKIMRTIHQKCKTLCYLEVKPHGIFLENFYCQYSNDPISEIMDLEILTTPNCTSLSLHTLNICAHRCRAYQAIGKCYRNSIIRIFRYDLIAEC